MTGPGARRWLLGGLWLALGCGVGDRPGEHATAASQALDASAERRTWLVALDGAPAAEAWLRPPGGGAPGGPAGAGRSRARLAELAVQHARVVLGVSARGAEVIGEMTRLSNGFIVLASDAVAEDLARLPEVTRVERAPLYATSLGKSLPVIGAPAAWAMAPGLHGEGVRVGIIDSGIDYLHADFGGSGSKDDFKNIDSTTVTAGVFPTARVIGGWDFVGDDYDAGNPKKNTPKPDPNPLDCNTKSDGGDYGGGHGTHVAGIAVGNGVTSAGKAYAGPYDATFSAAGFKVAPGVAPRASIYALRVFGCGGFTGVLPLALERAADPDQNGDFGDRLDVVNMSLGAAYALSADQQQKQLANLFAVGTVIVVASGNDGDTTFVTSAPGVLPQALSVAASQAKPWLALTVEPPAAGAGDYRAQEGAITQPLASGGPISGVVVRTDPPRACGPLVNAGALAGNVALIDRGECTFAQKLGLALGAGAKLVVMVDDEIGDEPPVMGGDKSVGIPGVMLRRVDGELLEAQTGVTVSIAPGTLFRGAGAEPIADFSSRGPAVFDGALKPEITAPGWDVFSAKVGSGSDGLSEYGTSMATPMVAGAAAIARQAHPDFDPSRIKAVLVSTAELIRGPNGSAYAASRQGGGRVAVARAAAANWLVHADGPAGVVALTFEPQIAAKPVTTTQIGVVENHGASDVSLTTSVERSDALPGVSVTVSPAQLSVPAGGSATFTATLALDPKLLGTPGPDSLTATSQFDVPRQHLNEAGGVVRFADGGGASVTVPYYGVVRAASDRQPTAPIGCAAADNGARDVAVRLTGSSAHPAPVVSAFELTHQRDPSPQSAMDVALGRTDVIATGIGSDVATAGIDHASVYFALAVARPWTTPAHGQISPIGILIDGDEDGMYDHTLSVEPYNATSPYLDLLIAQLRDMSGNPAGERRYVNLLPADAADTEPFFSDVIVLPVFAKDLGVDAKHTHFKYAPYRIFPTGIESPISPKLSYDLAHVSIDTALGDGGLPLYRGDLIRARVAAGVAKPQLLVVQHDNVPGARWQVVDLAAPAPEGLKLALDEAPLAGRGARGLTVTAAQALGGVHVTFAANGGAIVAASASQGTCASDGGWACDLGALAAGKSARVTVILDGPGPIDVVAHATSDLGCTTALQQSVPEAAAQTVAPLAASGGCGCRTARAERFGGHRQLVIFAFMIALLRRRQKRAPECAGGRDGSY